jgi:hypothetical protein
VNLPRWQGGGWFFNPLGWQLLFVLGFLLGQAARGAATVAWPRPRRWLTALALAGLAAAMVLLLAGTYQPDLLPEQASGYLATVDKTALHPLRLLSVLGITYLVATLVPRDAAWIASPWARPFLLMGRHSLPVFCFGILLSFMARLMLEAGDGWSMQLAVNLLSLGALVATGAFGEWQRRGTRLPAAAAAR